MHRLVHAQAFHIRPVDHRETGALADHLFRTLQGFETDELRLPIGFDPLEQVRQGKAQPRDHHRPGFHAAQPIDALFQLVGFDKILEGIGTRLADLAVDHHRPGLGLQGRGVFRRVALVRPELVEIVVVGGVLEWRDRLPLDIHRLPAGLR
ncbi:Uncharacterised protein [Acinetobacter baumannii]|nr:Uncharacterised protein [Acinetobacter baumannii]